MRNTNASSKTVRKAKTNLKLYALSGKLPKVGSWTKRK